MANFNNCVGKVLRVEGGYVNDPNDPGGETNFGVTKNIARWAGYTGEMKDLTMDGAKNIYKKIYWDVSCLDYVEAEDIALEIFDSSVNIGPAVVVTWLQTILNALNLKGSRWQDIGVDGQMGVGTVGVLNAACKFDPRMRIRIFNALNSFQTVHYFTIAKNDQKFETFMLGWLDNRVNFE